MKSQYYVASGILLCELTRSEMQRLHETVLCEVGKEIEETRASMLEQYGKCEVRVQQEWSEPLVRGAKPIRVS